MDIVLRRVAVGLRVARDVRQRIVELSAGRPLVIDHTISAVRGWRIGDLVVGFELARPPADYVEIEPVDEVPVIVERRLIGLLRRGARVVLGDPIGLDEFSIRLNHPEDWLDFLDGRPLPAG